MGQSNITTNFPILRRFETHQTSSTEEERKKWPPYLEAPNIMTGAFAAILTYCQLYRKEALGLVQICDNTCLVELESLKQFETVFDVLPSQFVPNTFKEQRQNIKITTESLKKFHQKAALSTHLLLYD